MKEYIMVVFYEAWWVCEVMGVVRMMVWTTGNYFGSAIVVMKIIAFYELFKHIYRVAVLIFHSQ